MIIVIDSPTALQGAAKHYHDATFSTDDIVFEERTRTFRVKINRPVLEKAVLKRKILSFEVSLTPRIESLLTFHNVNRMEIEQTSKSDILLSIEWDSKNGQLSMACAQNTGIKLQVDSLEGLIEDSGELFFNGFTIVKMFGLEICRYG